MFNPHFSVLYIQTSPIFQAIKNTSIFELIKLHTNITVQVIMTSTNNNNHKYIKTIYTRTQQTNLPRILTQNKGLISNISIIDAH